MTFTQFAWISVRRNFPAYLAYFLSGAFSVLVFFLFSLVYFHPRVATEFSSGPVRSLLMTGEAVIVVFAVLFVLISVAGFLRARSRELGILTVLGASRRQLNRLIMLENGMIGALAIGTALAVGLIFARYLFLIVERVLEVPELHFYVPTTAMLLTVACFTALFLGIARLAPALVGAQRAIDLLRGARKPQPEPKASFLLSALALLLLGAAYTIVILRLEIPYDYLVLTLLVTLGTYLFYTQLSVYLLKAARAFPRFYFRRTNLLWLTDLRFRIRDNARLLFVVTIITAASITAMAAVHAVYQTLDEEYAKSYPVAVSYQSLPSDPSRDAHTALIERLLSEHGFAYVKVSEPVLAVDRRGARITTAVIADASYNRMAAVLGEPPVQVPDGQALRVPVYINERVTVSGEAADLAGAEFRVTGAVARNIFPEGQFDRLYVVSEAAFRELAGRLKTAWYYGYAVPDWMSTGAAAAAIREAIDGQHAPGPRAFLLRTAADWYQKDRVTYRLIYLIGAFVSLIFFLASGSFIYFRLYNDRLEDARKFRSLRKLGLSDQEARGVITTQLGLLFLIPFAGALVHAIFALVMLQSFLSTSIFTFSLVVLAIYAALQALFFLPVRSRYLEALLETHPGR